MSRFMISCTTCSLRGYGRDEILSTFEHAPQAGFKYWGLAGPPLWTLGAARWFDADKVHRYSTQSGFVGCTEAYGPSFPTDSVESAELAAADVALMFDVADAVQAPLVVITGGKPNGETGLRAAVSGIRQMLPLIRNKRARLALEPHFGSQFQTRADYDYLFSQIDDSRVGITIDTGHFHSAGVDWKAIIRDFGSKIYNIHLKDHIGKQSVEIGKGEIDLHGLIEELHKIDYKGALAVEMEVEDPQNLPQYCKQSYSYISKLVKEVTGEDAL
ncbi:sugar phosphate isomerase/epimerase family protein [Paenibacillus montanisoli]|uniref:Xylose isomerase-like TIM barrel domain-containing protein n=1 Tax=Paenibacillus montanisoli TaxID=2081970 RepID=A0A328U7B9_9BACL|nr:sugar phosphate isomerase/epimerase family protein [Paenibacillus montanisoli]RAP78420.1 hypothetical protein DL346_08345 [Paenibacillus montanisoli]